MTLAELFDLVIDRAPLLRANGVRCLQLHALRIEIDAVEVRPVFTAAHLDSEPEEDSSDPLFDPATFGRKSGVPGFDITDDVTDDESDER
jgi:hypothetical protein